MSETQMVKAEYHALEPRNLNEAQALAKIAVESRMFAVKSPQEAMVILLTGRELGLTAMQSLRAIHVIQGRPVLSADLMAALVRTSADCEMWQIVESTPERCTIRAKRRGDQEPTAFSYSMEDAARAKLTGKDNWRMHPAAMLRARCAASLARAMFPDRLMGIYDPDELAEVAPPTTEQVRSEAAPDPPAAEQEQLGTQSAVHSVQPAEPAQDKVGPITPWLKRIQEAEAQGSEEHLDAVRTEMNASLKHRTKAQGEALRRAIDVARAAIRAAAPRQPQPVEDEERAAIREEPLETGGMTDEERRAYERMRAERDAGVPA